MAASITAPSGWQFLITRATISLLVIAPYYFSDIFLGNVKIEHLLGPLVISIFTASIWSLFWMVIYYIIRLSLSAFQKHQISLTRNSVFLTEIVWLYCCSGFAFLLYYYTVERHGSGGSFSNSAGPLLINGSLTELGLRDAIWNIVSVTIAVVLIQILSITHFLIKFDFQDGV